MFFGRLDPVAGRSPYELPQDNVRLVPLPHYPRVTSIGRVVSSVRRARRAFAAEVDSLDAVWLFGPHPLALSFARIARKRGVPVILGVRQNFPEYVRERLPSPWWLWAVWAAHALEWRFRRLGVPTVVVGDDLGRRYSAASAPLLVTGISLVREADLVPLASALASRGTTISRCSRSDGSNRRRTLFCCRRYSPGCAPGTRGGDCRSWVTGRCGRRRATCCRARRLLCARVTRVRTVGPALLDRYRSSHAFLHVSLTEGLPQVLFEAQAAGLPIVATDVGGVRAALGNGDDGLLVPPQDVGAPIDALESLARDADLRGRLIRASLESIAAQTMDVQLDRIAAFLRESARSA